MSLPMPSSVEDIAKVLVAADDAYSAHLTFCRDSPCLNCDGLTALLGDAMSALKAATTGQGADKP